MKTFGKIFLIIIGIIVVSYFLFTDMILRNVAEQQLTQAHGAEVNIADVDHSLFPASLTITDIQITDPLKPSQNQVSISKASVDVEIMPLLSKKLIAEELVIEELAFGQPRASEGQVFRIPDSRNSFGFPSVEDIPSVDELLANSPLETTKAVQDAQAAYDKHADTLKTQYEALPGEERIEYYKQQVKSLQETDYRNPQAIAEAKQKFDLLKEEIKADKAKIDTFRESASAAKADISVATANLQSAPQKDYELLQGLIAGDQAALQQVTQRLFGEKAAEYTQYLTLAIQTLAPMLAGNESAEPAPSQPISSDGIPNVWIKKAQASVLLNGQTISSEWENITDQHALINAPTLFSVNAQQSSLWQALDTQGQFELTDTGINAEQAWNIAGLKLSEFALSESQRISANITSGLLATSGSLTVNDNQINGGGKIDLAELVMSAAGSDNFTNALADALDDIANLGIDVNLKGELRSPSFSLSSDLDRQLASAVVTSLSGDQQGALSELRDKLNAKATGQLGINNDALAEIIDWQALASGNSALLDELAKSQLESVIDKQKNKLFDKLKDKLTN